MNPTKRELCRICVIALTMPYMADVAVWNSVLVRTCESWIGACIHMEPDIENNRESDEALMQKVARRDECAFSELYDRFSSPLFGLMRQMLGDEQEAEDVLQEGFVNLWDRTGSFDPEKGKAFSWAVMIFRNKAIDRIRARGRRARLNEKAAEEPGLWTGDTVPNADSSADEQDRATLVRKALSALPTEQRRLIELAFLKGETHHQIAELLGMPLGSVKTSIRRGLLRLRGALKHGTS